jgi:hypothetical protein
MVFMFWQRELQSKTSPKQAVLKTKKVFSDCCSVLLFNKFANFPDFKNCVITSPATNSSYFYVMQKIKRYK